MIDWLFWIWVIVTILMFLNLIIPDPIPFIDEALLIVLFFILLLLMGVRALISGVVTLLDTVFHPAVIAFVATFVALLIFNKVRSMKKGRRRK